jgi:hypothetical protein
MEPPSRRFPLSHWEHGAWIRGETVRDAFFAPLSRRERAGVRGSERCDFALPTVGLSLFQEKSERQL